MTTDCLFKSLPFKYFRNYPIPIRANELFFREAADYIPKKNDVFIVSYPKSGTTWVQHIVYLLFNGGVPSKSVAEVLSAIPFVEQDGFIGANDNPLALKYHLPFWLTPYSEDAKYIYIARNPKDCCVSYYHFLKNLPGYELENFDHFYEAFVSGRMPYGDIMDHISSWYEQKHLSNVLFLTYESLIEDTRASVQKIARFLGFNRLDDDTLNGVLIHSSFSSMKQRVDGDKHMQMYLRMSTGTDGNSHKDIKPVMLRKGIVGDWKNHLSKEQNSRLELHFRKKTDGTKLRDLWKNHFV